MKKYRLSVRIAIAIMGMALLLQGCEGSEKTIAKPLVIQKKIGMEADQAKPDPLNPETKPALAQVKPEMPLVPVPEPTSPPKSSPAAPTERPDPVPPTSTMAPSVVAGVVSQAALQPEGSSSVVPSMAISDPQMAAHLHIKAPDPYNAKGKVDPFEPLLRDETTPNVVHLKAKKRTPSTPLENIDIGQLKLVAIIGAANGNLAMVQESSGKGYIIRPGTFIGTNSGKVSSIEADKVFFEEEYEDVHGKTITKTKEMTLPKPPGELLR